MKEERRRRLLPIIQKIRVFTGLTPREVDRLVAIGHYRTYLPNERIYKLGDPSQEMVVVLQGKLVATSRAGTTFGEILPGTSTGEMGVFTGQVRSANVVATCQSAGLVIRKRDLDALFRSNCEMETKVLRNIVALLCERLAQADRQIENYAEGEQGKQDAEENVKFVCVVNGGLQ